MGQPTVLTIELALKVISDIYDGISIAQSARDHGFSQQTFYNLKKEVPLLEEQYACAREAFADICCDQVIAIADSDIDAQKVRNRIDARKWIAKVLNPKVYGDKVEMNHTGTVDLLAAMKAGDGRVRDVIESSSKAIESSGSVENEGPSLDVEDIFK